MIDIQNVGKKINKICSIAIETGLACRFVLFILLCGTSVYSQNTFDPSTISLEIHVEKATDKINIDGSLYKASWKYAKSITELVQYEPSQGEAPSLKTEIRILFDEKNLECFFSPERNKKYNQTQLNTSFLHSNQIS